MIIELILEHIDVEELEIEIHRTVFEKIKDYFSKEANPNPADLISLFDDEIQSYLREITIEQHTISHAWFEKHPSINSENNLYRYAADLLTKFRQLHIDIKISENQKAIENADSEEIALNLMRENLELEKKKREVKITIPGQKL